MYEKPELTLVGSAMIVVLGVMGAPKDNEFVGDIGMGIVAGLDE